MKTQHYDASNFIRQSDYIVKEYGIDGNEQEGDCCPGIQDRKLFDS